MNKQNFIVKSKRIFVGLEDSKRMWKVCVRAEGMVVHGVSIPAEYDNLWRYLRSRYPECTIQVMYEAGFSGFWLHDCLEADGERLSHKLSVLSVLAFGLPNV